LHVLTACGRQKFRTAVIDVQERNRIRAAVSIQPYSMGMVKRTVLRWVVWASVEASERQRRLRKRIEDGRGSCRGFVLVAGRSGSATLLCRPSDLTEDAQQEGGYKRPMGNDAIEDRFEDDGIKRVERTMMRARR
jgi:hypothetical protein